MDIILMKGRRSISNPDGQRISGMSMWSQLHPSIRAIGRSSPGNTRLNKLHEAPTDKDRA